MAYEDIEILVQGFRWHETIATKEQNFFAQTFAGGLHDEINMKSVMVMNPLTVKKIFDNIEKENGKFTLFHVTEELKFQFLNFEYVPGDPYLDGSDARASDIFRCFEDTQRCKWQIKIMHRGLPVWLGVIKPKDISFTNADLCVNVSAYGIEAEFGEYYTNKTLIETISNNIQNGNATYDYFDGSPGSRERIQQFYRLNDVVAENFPNNGQLDFQINTNLVGDWLVNDFPIFVNNDVVFGTMYDFVFIKGGYRKLYQENVSRLQWLSKTCNAMGWQFFFQFIGATLTLFVVPRSRNNLTYIQKIDYNDINPDWSCGKRGVKEKFGYIEIPCGALTGGDLMFFGDEPVESETNPNDLKGNNITIISDEVGFVNKSVHFDALDGGGHPVASTGYAFLKYNGEDDNTYKAVAWTSDDVNYIHSTATYYDIPKTDLLRIDSGLNATKFIKIAGLGIHHDMEVGGAVDDNDLVVQGCYGDLLFKLDDEFHIYYTYQDYVLSDEFRLNFVPFLAQNKENEVNFNVSDIYSNPYTTLRIDNSENEGAQVFKGKYFATSEIETDYFNDTTTYSVFETTI